MNVSASTEFNGKLDSGIWITATLPERAISSVSRGRNSLAMAKRSANVPWQHWLHLRADGAHPIVDTTSPCTYGASRPFRISYAHGKEEGAFKAAGLNSACLTRFRGKAF